MKIHYLSNLLTASHQVDDSVLVTGLHGIGKTEIALNWAEESNVHMEPLYLSTQEVGDLIGNPKVKEVNGEDVTIWTVPIWLQKLNNSAWPTCKITDLEFKDEDFKDFIPKDIDKITRLELTKLYQEFYDLPDGSLILGQTKVRNKKSRFTSIFLDEISRAPLDVRQAALQLVLDRKIHQHDLPITNGQRTFIVAADNPDNGDYAVEELDRALIDRFTSVDVEVDVQGWLDWARVKKVNKIVRAFIADNPSKLHFMPEDGSDDKVGATPRSWTKLGAYIDIISTVPKELHYTIINGKIGKALASQFLNFMNNYQSMVSVEDIEMLVKELSDKGLNIEQIGKGVAELTKDSEVVQKTELINALVDKYINEKDNLPMMAMFYSLETEILAATLKKISTKDEDNFFKLAEIDRVLNDKKLFTKITRNLSLGL